MKDLTRDRPTRAYPQRGLASMAAPQGGNEYGNSLRLTRMRPDGI